MTNLYLSLVYTALLLYVISSTWLCSAPNLPTSCRFSGSAAAGKAGAGAGAGAEVVTEDAEYNARSTFSNTFRDVHSDVQAFVYEPLKNPNRLGFQFRDDRGTGKIEQFVNARASRYDPSTGVFYAITQLRQSTVRQTYERKASQTFGDYAVEMTFNTLNTFNAVPSSGESGDSGPNASQPRDSSGVGRVGGESISGKVIIASYLPTQDPLYFDRPELPVALFAYDVLLTR